ncbi:MAG: response regulator transcription factor [Deltaproteobacteria bacterium]|nr:response regulator transcription factor [Deltaproteobacteria bacterium]
MKGRVFVVEDDELIGAMVELNLRQEGYEVDWVQTGEPALSKVRASECDLILMDIMLPDADGVELVRELRSMDVVTPILMMTARDDVETKVQALDCGADDYLTKPFDTPELLARVRALIRRSQGERHQASTERVMIGRHAVNTRTHVAESNEGDVQLSAKEFELLGFFLRKEGATLSRADILEEVWGMEVYVSERTIDNFIVRFRKLFEDDPENPKRFITVRGVGYRFERAE